MDRGDGKERSQERVRRQEIQLSQLIQALSASGRSSQSLEQPQGGGNLHADVQEFCTKDVEASRMSAREDEQVRTPHKQSPVEGSEGQQSEFSVGGELIRQVEEDRKAFLEAVRENSQSLVSGLQALQTPAAVVRREPKHRKLEDADAVEHYLVAFEWFATTYHVPKEAWAQRVAPLLTGKAQAAYACMYLEKMGDYDKLKKPILRRYDITEETYR